MDGEDWQCMVSPVSTHLEITHDADELTSSTIQLDELIEQLLLYRGVGYLFHVVRLQR